MICFVYYVRRLEYINDEHTQAIWVYKPREISLHNKIISCTTNQTETDFSISLELSEYLDFIQMGGLIRADVDGKPFEFRIKSINYTESSGVMSVSAKYRGFDLNGIYPKIIKGDMRMLTPKGAADAIDGWWWYGGYDEMIRQEAEQDQYNRYVNSVVKCTEDGFIFPFYLSTIKSVTDIAYNDIAGAIGYNCRPCDLKDFEIVRPSKDVQYEFVKGVNIADISIETTETDKPAGVVAFYKNPNNNRFALGETYYRTVPGRCELYDASKECTPEEVPADPDVEYDALYRAAESRQKTTNPTFKSFDTVYTITPTQDVKGINIFDHVAIYSDNVDANPLYYGQYIEPGENIYDAYKVRDISIKSLSYDCVNECYLSIVVGDRKSDFIDLMISESKESDRLDSVQYKNVIIHPEQWSDTGEFSFTVSNASGLQFFEISNYSDEIDYYVGDTEEVRVISVTGTATKTITVRTNHYPAILPRPEWWPPEYQVMGDRTLILKMWKRG